MGLFSSKETAVNTIISEVSKNYDEEGEIDNYRNQLKDGDSICDLEFTNWDIIKVKIEGRLKILSRKSILNDR